MVRAILDGSKTQTRRVVKPQPARAMAGASPVPVGTEDWVWPYPKAPHAACISNRPNGPDGWSKHCPYGQPGDRLWVRETYDPIYGHDGRLIEVDYHATYEHGHRMGDHLGFKKKWRPSIHMPRTASRITLEVTGVRVERLQAISEADARAEGVEGDSHPGAFIGTCRGNFARLWESLNGAGSWDANPWVWVIEFGRVDSSGGAG